MLSQNNVYNTIPMKVMVLSVIDENGIYHICYLLIKKNIIAQLEKAIQAGTGVKLENYGIVYCNIPSDFISDALDKKIIRRLNMKYGFLDIIRIGNVA